MGVVQEKSEQKPLTNTKDDKVATPKKPETDEERRERFWQGPLTYLKRYHVLLPHVLPEPDIYICFRYAGIIACVLSRRVLNILIPMMLGQIVETLSNPLATNTLVLKKVLTYIVLRFLNTGAGVQYLESRLWQPVQLEATARLDVAAYRHVMTLSSDYHDNKKTAAVWEGVRSGRSVVQLIWMISFDLLPRVFDLILAMGLLWTKYDIQTAWIAVATMVVYNWISVQSHTKRRVRIKKRVSTRGKESNVLMETATNWPTVAYFNRFSYETKRYEDAVRETRESLQEDRSEGVLVDMSRQATVLLGLGSACLCVASQVRRGEKSATDFIVFTTYWTQLIGPLTSFVGIFLWTMGILVETEKLVEIFETQPSIKEADNAKDVEFTAGKIEFHNVSFSYKEEREILKGISFQCTPGSTTAIVGETGGGKSTILKLMARLYDTTSGSVTIDQQDIKQLKLDSLRECFGHVPQSIGVFNTTILENLRYGKLDATLEECQEACKAAALHDRILTFPEGYETIVGEKGVKLSGGELQRLAIARVVLKNPKILLLDEATSSVDTATEALIQESLKNVTKARTTIVVAHRLSTIAHADLILVVKEGQIVERGNHRTLLAQQGMYYGLWNRQEVKEVSSVKMLRRAKSCPSLQMR